jgi:CBS domain-containing protein
MDASELCMRTVVIAHAEERVLDAARRMMDLHVGSLVLVEEVDGGRRPTGIVTDRDLLFAVVRAEPQLLEELRLDRYVRRDLVTARESDSVSAVLDRMRERGVRRVPVVDDGGMLIGILAYDDLVDWVAEQVGSLSTLASREQKNERARPA